MAQRIKTYRDWIVWPKAMNWVAVVSQSTKKFTKEETFGLSAQI